VVVVPPSHAKYGEVSTRVFSTFRSITPLVEGLSLDEAFLDVGGLRRHYESPVAVADDVRSRLRAELGLPASVGIAAIKFVAKLASEAAKPDGVRLVRSKEQTLFLDDLPVTAMWGVGPATHAALTRLGVETVGDIASLPLTALVGAVGPSAGRHLHDLANGIDPRAVVPDSEAKSVSVEETYEHDLDSLALIETALLSHAQRLSSRLRRAGLRGRTITLKLRYADFTTITRSHTSGSGVDGARQLYRIATELLATRDRPDPVRLLGLGAGSLESADAPQQLDIAGDVRWDEVENAVADVRRRFGEESLRPARLLGDRQSTKRDEEP
jgi:DNA polymerase-4